jgi:hypothetical protein
MIRLPGGAGFSLGTGCHPLALSAWLSASAYNRSHRLLVSLASGNFIFFCEFPPPRAFLVRPLWAPLPLLSLALCSTGRTEYNICLRLWWMEVETLRTKIQSPNARSQRASGADRRRALL